MVRVAKDAPKNAPSDYLPYDPAIKQWWTSDPKGESILQEAATGVGNYKTGVPLHTLPELFAKAAKLHPNKAALRSEMAPALKKGESPGPAVPLKEWKMWTWGQYYKDCRSVAKAMISLGLEQHDSVNIFGFNSPEWLMSMMGAVLAGGKAAGIYPSDTAEQLQFKSDHSNGAIACVEDDICMNKYKQVIDRLPYLKAIVSWATPPGEDITTSDGRVVKTLSFQDLLALGESLPDAPLEERISAIKPSHGCALIYTSGTTGFPKAVAISHDSVNFEAVSCLLVSDVIGKKNKEERLVSYLPLSHVAGMLVDVLCPIVVSANISGFKGWYSTNFARPYDLKRGTLVDRLKSVQPSVFLGVPRVWEKMMEKLKEVGASSKGLQKAMSSFAKKRAAVYTASRQLGGEGKTPANMGLAKVVLGVVRKKLGLDRAKFCFSGAAPMTLDCLQFFGALGINVNEVYGMSECTGAATWSTEAFHLWGSVGFEVPGCELRVLREDGSEAAIPESVFSATEAEQGELCYRGRAMMMGYMANPRLGAAHVEEIAQKNRDCVDERGFVHSGDKGTRDVHGMVKITGRYKELIITAGGENIAPVPIEDELKRLLPFVANVMMVGNKKKFNVALFTLKAMGATGELPGGDKLAPPASTFSEASKLVSEAMEDVKFSDAIREAIVAVNKNEAVCPSNAAKIQKFTILPRDFSVLTGELTATLKLKRGVVDEVFAPIIDKMYEMKEEYVKYALAPTVGLAMGEEGAEVPVEKGMSFSGEQVVDAAAAAAEEEEEANKA